MLRMIEEINKNDEDKLQNDFDVYDHCSGISKINFQSKMYKIQTKNSLSGGPDECQVAADIYQCGRDIAPVATADIFTISKGNATVVCYIFQDTIRCSLLTHNYEKITNWIRLI
jgi:hypothetical protein